MKLSLILFILHLWGSDKASSQRALCPAPPNVPHAFVSDETEKAEYKEGDVIRFTCETGYISGPTIRYICSDGRWVSLYHGKCFLKPCELPDETPNGYYEIVFGTDFVFGTSIKYFCNEGYQMASKHTTRICMLSGWTNHVPICDPVSCEVPSADERMTIDGLPGNDDAIYPDRFLTFSCSPGTQLIGSSILICGKDGQWNNPTPSCEDITCKVDKMHRLLNISGVPPTNGTVKIGHKLQFQCNNHSVLLGSYEAECLPSGEWNRPFPTCVENCIITNVPQGVYIRSPPVRNQLSIGQKLTFSCYDHRHVLRGNAEIVCVDSGRWSHPFPTCGEPLGCGKPPHLPDGDTKESLGFKFNHNARVEYICQDSFTIEGVSHKTCINGEWIGQMRCLRPCTVDKAAMDRHNVAFRHRNTNKLYAPHNDYLEFMCVRGRHDGLASMRQKCNDGSITIPLCI